MVHGESAQERWSSWEHGLKNAAEKVCGRSKGGKKCEVTWWCTVVPLYKGKGNVLECGNYRTIKLLEHGMKVVEHVFEKRLRKMVEIRGEQYGFVAGKGTIDAIFILRQLQEKYLENDKELYLVYLTGYREC